jgi:hypothetical protein
MSELLEYGSTVSRGISQAVGNVFPIFGEKYSWEWQVKRNGKRFKIYTT